MKLWKTLIMGFGVALAITGCAGGETELNAMTRHVLEHDGLEREFFDEHRGK